MADRSEFQYGIRAGVPDVDRRTRGLELPPPGKTVADVERESAQGQSKTSRYDKKKVIASVALGGLIGLQAGPQISEYVHNPNFNPQALVRDITSLPGAVLSRVLEITQGWNWFQKPEVAVPETFDPKATKGVIGENNSVDIPVDEVKTKVNNEKASVPLIIRLPEGYTGNINYQINSFGLRREGKLINDQLVLSNLPVGTEIISPWDGKINQGSGRSPVLRDGSWEDLQAKIRAKDENGNEFSVTLSTGRVRNVIDSPNAVGYPVLENDSVSATNIKKGDVLAVIASTGNSRWFEGQVSLSIAAKKGAVDIQIATQDGKAIALQGSN